MSRVFVGGWGAVSPAGWGFASLDQALQTGTPIPAQPVARPGWSHPIHVRKVPSPGSRPAFLAHPRLRRSSPVSHYALGAGLEALETSPDAKSSADRLGVVFAVMCGCVRYSRQFYDEVLQAPATASPLLFPETVYNAPSSHLAAFLGSRAINYTLVGDDGVFLLGLSVAAEWIQEGRVDRCLVVASEETDWLTADSFRHFSREGVVAEGAGALLLQRGATTVELASISDPELFPQRSRRALAARRVRAQMPHPMDAEMLFDSQHGVARLDRDESQAWNDWTGPRFSAKPVLGEGFAAGAAWQCAMACGALKQGKAPAAQVVVVGCHQQAIAARFLASHSEAERR